MIVNDYRALSSRTQLGHRHDGRQRSGDSGEAWDDCHTALPGEDCHRHVTWAMTRGIHTETAAEDYPGLTKDSSFRESAAAAEPPSHFVVLFSGFKAAYM